MQARASFSQLLCVCASMPKNSGVIAQCSYCRAVWRYCYLFMWFLITLTWKFEKILSSLSPHSLSLLKRTASDWQGMQPGWVLQNCSTTEFDFKIIRKPQRTQWQLKASFPRTLSEIYLSAVDPVGPVAGGRQNPSQFLSNFDHLSQLRSATLHIHRTVESVLERSMHSDATGGGRTIFTSVRISGALNCVCGTCFIPFQIFDDILTELAKGSCSIQQSRRLKSTNLYVPNNFNDSRLWF